MAAWHVGISKLEQVLADDNWGNAPIGAGPFSLTYDPDSGLTELTRVDLVGRHWNGPHDTPIIEKLVLPNIEDEQARLIMFENGELDVMRVDRETYEAALDPGHPFNPMLYSSPLRRAVVHQAEDRGRRSAGGPYGPQGPGSRRGHGEHRQRYLGAHGDPCKGPDLSQDTLPQPGRRPSAVRPGPRSAAVVVESPTAWARSDPDLSVAYDRPPPSQTWSPWASR